MIKNLINLSTRTHIFDIQIQNCTTVVWLHTDSVADSILFRRGQSSPFQLCKNSIEMAQVDTLYNAIQQATCCIVSAGNFS